MFTERAMELGRMAKPALTFRLRGKDDPFGACEGSPSSRGEQTEERLEKFQAIVSLIIWIPRDRTAGRSKYRRNLRIEKVRNTCERQFDH